VPIYANGKIGYIEMPATDIARCAEFYGRVLGWNVRRRGDGSTAFDDSTGQVSGGWVLGRLPTERAGAVVLQHGGQRGSDHRVRSGKWR
jgi:uncharacterized protein